MKLVPNWQKAWKWFSVQAMVLSGAVTVAWAELPSDLRDTLPEWLGTALAAGILVLGVVGRLVDQE